MTGHHRCAPRLPRTAIRGTALSLLALAVLAHDAAASQFSVNPVQIHLSTGATSTRLTLRNESDRALQVQLTAFAWDQTPLEQLQLAPTTDIVVVPSLVTLAPGEARTIRIGIATPFGPIEKSYRLAVEELPNLDQPREAATHATVLTKVGIPIFLEAAQPLTQGALEELMLDRGRLAFRVRNGGNTHFVTEKIFVQGFDVNGDIVLDRQVAGWYVLAGRVRQFQIELGEDGCERMAVASVEVKVGSAVLKERLDAPASACTP